MDVDITDYLSDPNNLNLLARENYNKVNKIVSKILYDENFKDGVQIIETITQAVENHEELLEICEHILDDVWSSAVPELYRPIIVGFLNNSTDLLEEWKLERLCFRIGQKLSTECCEKICIFDIFCKALVRLQNTKDVANSIIESSCSINWANENIIDLLRSLQGYPLTNESKKVLLMKFLSMLPDCDQHQIPQIINLLALFSSPKWLSLMLFRLTDYFVPGRLSGMWKPLRPRIMTDFYNLCNQNEQFTANLFQVIGTLERDVLLNDFFLTLLLTLLPIELYQNRVSKLLTSAIVATFTDNQLIHESCFLRDLHDAWEDPTQRILDLCQQCTTDSWNYTMRGLLLLGFNLLRASSYNSVGSATSSRGPCVTKSIAGRQQKPTTSPFISGGEIPSKISHLAVSILTHLFKNCPNSREEIMTILVNVIWSDSSKSTSIRLMELLNDLVALCPTQLAPFLHRLYPLIDCIGLVPLELSISLVHALLPLIRAGTKLNDAMSSENQSVSSQTCVEVRTRLLKRLCRAAASPRAQDRQTAVACFLLMLKHLKVSVSSFRSASQHSSSNSLSQSSPFTQTQMTQMNPCLLYTQLQSTQFAQQAVALPCDVIQNEALCTEIVAVLHRVIFSTFFRTQSGSLPDDSSNRVKSTVYLGLCEVVTRNRGLCEPVLNLYLRLLLACLCPRFVQNLKRNNTLTGLTTPGTATTNVHTAEVTSAAIEPAICLSDIVRSSETGDCWHTEHPDLLVWCLQLVITLPQFSSSWRRYRLQFARLHSTETNRDTTEPQFSQFTQSSNLSDSIGCGRPTSFALFSKAATLLLSLSDSLRNTPLEEYGIDDATDFGSNSNGKLNRNRAHVLLGLYDACLELELKNPLEGVSAAVEPQPLEPSQCPVESNAFRVRILFARRSKLRNLVYGKQTESSGTTQQSSGIGSILLLPTSRDDSDFRAGLLLMGLVSISQSGLQRVLKNSFRSDSTSKTLAHHLLNTIVGRISQFSRCSGGGIPCAYRDTLIQTMVPILRRVIRFYNQKLLCSENLAPPSTSAIDRRTNNGTVLDNTVPLDEPNNTATVSTSANSSSALNVLNTAFALTLDHLGIKRLYTLCIHLHKVTNDPNCQLYSGSLDENELYDNDDEDDDDDYLDIVGQSEDAQTTATNQTPLTPAVALSAVIKMLKNWITKILHPLILGTQKSCNSLTNTRDIIYILPLLVRLCRARASLSSDTSPYTGLDRVLCWLLRLTQCSNYASNSMTSAVRVQLVAQTLWLAHLVGKSSEPDSSLQSTPTLESDYRLQSLLPLLSTDLHNALGSLYQDPNSSSIGGKKVPYDPHFLILVPWSAVPFLPVLFAILRQSLLECDWLLALISPSLGGRIKPNDATNLSSCLINNTENEFESSLCLYLVGLGETLCQLMDTSIPAPSIHVDTLFDFGARIYRFLTQLVKYYLRVVRSRRGRFPVLFERVVRVFGKVVSPNAYKFIAYIQRIEREKVKNINNRGNVKKLGKENIKKTVDKSLVTKDQNPSVNVPRTLVARSIKDTRLIPPLIFAIEQFERFLMQLSKRSKVNLMRNVKLTISRDFRINRDTVAAYLERSVVANPDSSTDDENEPEPIDQPVATVNDDGDTGSETEIDQPPVTSTQSERPTSTPIDPSNLAPMANSSLITANTPTPVWHRSVNSNAHRESALKRPSTRPQKNFDETNRKFPRLDSNDS